MKKTDDTTLITVGQLVKGLEGYEKKHWDWNVEITTDEPLGEEEDLPCIMIGMGLDEDGDLRIEIEEEWAGGGDYYVGELLPHLRDFDSGTRVYLAGGGLLFSIDNDDGIFADTNDGDDTLSCYATAFGEYKYEPSGWLTESEKRKLAEEARKKKREERIEYIVLALLTVFIIFGLCYNVYALNAHTTRHQPWEHILGIVACVIVLVVCGGTLFYARDSKKGVL